MSFVYTGTQYIVMRIIYVVDYLVGTYPTTCSFWSQQLQKKKKAELITIYERHQNRVPSTPFC